MVTARSRCGILLPLALHESPEYARFSFPGILGTLMRVAVINTHPIQHFAPLWREIAKSGQVELKIFYCSDWGIKEYADPGFGTVFKWDVDLLSGYHSEFLPIRARPKNLGFWETDNPRVGDALLRFAPDVVVIFGYSHLTDWRALLWAKRHGARLLVFADSELKHGRSVWVRLAKQLVVRGFLCQVDGVLPIGNCNADYYRHYGVPSDIMYWCAFPVDGSRFVSSIQDLQATRSTVRSKFGIGCDDFVFASIGKYIRRKRHEDVIKAWLRLSQSVRDRSCVIVVGEGPLRPELEKLAAEAGGRAILTGFVNQSEIPAYFAACDVLVVASEIDAHPLVVTESLFFGRSVIASDAIGCIGPDDTVRAGENGIVYPCGDVNRLSQAMSRLLEDADLRQRFERRSREISSGQDIRATADKFSEAFRRVMTSQRLGWVQRMSRLIPVLPGRPQ